MSYTFLKKGETNSTSKVNVVELTLDSYRMVINKTYLLQDLEFLAISYLANQPTNLQLWNDSFCPISIFVINKFLERDAKNIVYSLYRMVFFIRQHRLEDITVENVFQIAKFGFAAWNFLLSIYELEWDKLIANKDTGHLDNMLLHSSMQKFQTIDL